MSCVIYGNNTNWRIGVAEEEEEEKEAKEGI